MTALTVDVRGFPAGTVLEVAGELDFTTVDGFHDVLRRPAPPAREPDPQGTMAWAAPEA
ncbi:hypothetical protein GCM10027187_71380 [Streptosporangium sandarakinum]